MITAQVYPRPGVLRTARTQLGCDRCLTRQRPISSTHGRRLCLRQCVRDGSNRRRTQMVQAKNTVPEGLHTVTPHLAIDNAAEAIDWYKQALGAEERGDRAVGPDGKI